MIDGVEFNIPEAPTANSMTDSEVVQEANYYEYGQEEQSYEEVMNPTIVLSRDVNEFSDEEFFKIHTKAEETGSLVDYSDEYKSRPVFDKDAAMSAEINKVQNAEWLRKEAILIEGTEAYEQFKRETEYDYQLAQARVEQMEADFYEGIDSSDHELVNSTQREIQINEDGIVDLDSYRQSLPEVDMGKINAITEELKTTQQGKDAIRVVTDVMDSVSTEIAAAKPEVLPIISNHIANGVYPMIMEQLYVAKQRGDFNGVPDLIAYQIVGEVMDNNGAFNHIKGNQQAKQRIQEKEQQRQNQEQNKRQAMRSIAAPRKAAPLVQQEFNPDRLSDADLLNLVHGHMSSGRA